MIFKFGRGFIFVLALVACVTAQLRAESKKSVGLTLLSPSSARSLALSEAVASVSDDASTAKYNPATWATLTRAQASFLYEKGFAEDKQGQFYIGRTTRRLGFGLSVGFYDGAEFLLSDGVSETTVKSQRDLSIGLGLAVRAGKTALGFTGKHFQSTLLNKYKGSATMVDLGALRPLSSRLQLGIAMRNLGSKLTYGTKSEPLPAMAQLGASFLLSGRDSRMKATIFSDARYRVHGNAYDQAFGLELGISPLVFRAGTSTSEWPSKLALGAGFTMGQLSLDYAFGMMNTLDSRHLVSLSMKFGTTKKEMAASNKRNSAKNFVLRH